jgi:hypothetical protein
MTTLDHARRVRELDVIELGPLVAYTRRDVP